METETIGFVDKRDRGEEAGLSPLNGLKNEPLKTRQVAQGGYASTHKSRLLQDREIEFHDVLRGVPDPKNVVRIIARGFYKDLRKAGFTDNHVLNAAAELVGSVTEAIRQRKSGSESHVGQQISRGA